MKNIFLSLCLAFISLNVHAQLIKYTYDKPGRLVREIYPDSSIVSYTYDATGNRISKKVVKFSCDSLKSPAIIAGGPTSFCTGDSVMLTSINSSSYLWSNGQTTQSIWVKDTGIYTVNVIIESIYHCPKTSLPLVIRIYTLPPASVTTDTTICNGNSIFIGDTGVIGNTYSWTSYPSGFKDSVANPLVNPNISTTYYLTETVSSTGCTKSDSVSVKVNFASSDSFAVTVCNYYIFGGKNLNSSGIYYDTLVNALGCDSILKLNLTINNSNGFSSNITVCDKYTFAGNNLTTSGVYYDTLTNASGCDSVVTLNLTINISNGSSSNITACNQYIFAGNNLTSSGIYYDTLTNVSGCDSVITLNLTINKSNGTSSNITACNQYIFAGNNITTSGIYYDTLTNVSGCDSVITLNLTINKSTDSNINIVSCSNYMFGGNLLTASGLYQDTILSSVGCDSIISLNLTIHTIDTMITLNGKILTATEIGAAYQWLDCGNNYAPILGAFNQTYTPLTSGDYAVKLNKNGCQDTSACKTVIISGMGYEHSDEFLTVYPNPTDGMIHIVYQSSSNGNIEINVRDILGKIIYTNKFSKSGDVFEMNYSFDGYASGVYMLECVSNNGKATKKIVVE